MSRSICPRCRKASVMCYCGSIESFRSTPQFIILIHPRESRKAINTGRMAYLHLQNALLLVGSDFTEHSGLNAILEDPRKRCFLLFPGDDAIELDTLQKTLSPSADPDIIFIILDATWKMAKKMYQSSPNLQTIPRVMFRPARPSGFLIRQQPKPECYSTIETIHHIIECLGTHPEGEHHRLLTVFQDMVQKQIDYELGL